MRQLADLTFAGLLEAAPDATVCVDSDGVIVLVNAQAERLFGYPREELAGQPVEILVPDASKAAYPDLRAGYATDPQPRLMGAGLELSGRRRDGTTFPAEIALSALDTDQGLLVSAAIRDVTEQRQARDDLKRTNQNLQSFSYSLAHDLRTPLRSLAGFSTVLIEDYADTLGEGGCGYAQRIGAASEHMGHVLDDLLHLSHISQAEISLQPIDLGAEAAIIAAELQRQDSGRRVRFTIQQPARALADGTLIREVLHNLLDNAWKFTNGCDDVVHAIPASAYHPRVLGHRRRSRQRAPDRSPPRRTHMGRGGPRPRRYVLLHLAGSGNPPPNRMSDDRSPIARQGWDLAPIDFSASAGG